MSVIIGIYRHFTQEKPGGSPAHVCGRTFSGSGHMTDDLYSRNLRRI